MRVVLAAVLASMSLPAYADTLTADSIVTDVTLFPQGAKITREVRFDGPASGQHKLVVTDLPTGVRADTMQLTSDDGITLGAYSLRTERLPPRDDAMSPQQQAAKAVLEQAEANLRAAQTKLAEGQAIVDAALARQDYIKTLVSKPPEGSAPGELREFVRAISEETLSAANDAARARAELWPAQKAVQDAQEDVAQAKAALATLPTRDSNYTGLSIDYQAHEAGPNLITVTYYISNASWRPAYDLQLDRGDNDVLTIDRSIIVSQQSGEDWGEVELTLSSSRPADHAAPSHVSPRQIWLDERDGRQPLSSPSAVQAQELSRMAELDRTSGNAPISAAPGLRGQTVVYDYPHKVDVASGADDLRLQLSRLAEPAEVVAVAVPSRDETAFMVAEFTNNSGEPLLPGDAMLHRDGVLIGATRLGLIPAGEEAEVGFGPIDSLLLSRDMPQREGGQRGVFSTSNQRTETATLRVRNVGGEGWPIRLIDQVPYSEQDTLTIKTDISPAPTETDPDGERGILVWEFDLAPDASTEVSLGYTLSWPEGMVLR